MNTQIFIGVAVAVTCLLGIRHEKWLLANTKKGQRIVRWFGEAKAPWVWRGLCGIGILFGVLLAADIIRPVQW